MITAKRSFDVIMALAGLTALAPVFAAVALGIWATDGGKPFYTQMRVGKDGLPFKLYKFRSMVKDAESLKLALLGQNQHGGGVTFKMKKDPRVTFIGGLIRRASIDELPQLWNIVKGDMSIVGPRPAVPSEVDRYSLSDRERLGITPGLTCTWQVSGRSEIPFPEQVRLDVEYIRDRSFWNDLGLIARTVPAVLSARGAY